MNLALLSSYLTYAAPLISLLGIIVGIYHYKRLPGFFKIIFYYLILALIFDVSSKAVGRIYKTNLVFISSFAVFELLLFGYLYARFMFEKKLSKVVAVITILGLAAVLYDCFKTDYFPTKFQTYARTIGDFLIVSFSMMYFFVKLSKGTNPGNNKIVLNTYVLIYFALHFIFFIPINFIVNASTTFIYAFLIGNMILTASFYGSLLYLLWKNGRILKPSPSGLG